jgi:hypothetical protein
MSRQEILGCNSSGPLYPLQLSSAQDLSVDSTSLLWHRHLGHTGHDVISKVARVIPFSNKEPSTLCHACQLGVTLVFPFSHHRLVHLVLLSVHCHLWTSPIVSVSGFKYYLLILDDFSHYLWMFPLRLKSDTFGTLTSFLALVRTQFGVTIKALQCDNGREFDNACSRTFFLTHDIHLRMSCPYTSSHNGRA